MVCFATVETLSILGLLSLYWEQLQYLAMAWPTRGVGLFFLTAHFWYIPFEEKNMTAVFGTAYLEYKKKVRRWV